MMNAVVIEKKNDSIQLSPFFRSKEASFLAFDGFGESNLYHMNGTTVSFPTNFSSYSAAILDKVRPDLREFTRHVANNIATDLDRQGVPVMFVEFFNFQFEFISYLGRPVIHIRMIASNHTFNVQHRHENPNGRERD